MKKLSIAVALSLPFLSLQSHANNDDGRNIVRVGYADVRFNIDSEDLKGLPGTTPSGVKAGVLDTNAFALIYERRLSGPWSLVFQAGAPPTVDLVGDGVASPLGKVGSAKAWFPALLLAYNMDFQWVEPYVAAGMHYTWFSDEDVSQSYNDAFGGTTSESELDDSVGAVFKVGAEFPLGGGWSAGVSYNRYWIDTTATVTTATPGVGDIERTIDVDADPDVYSVTLGYRF